MSGWYDAGKRDLPWRRTRDPYAIWVAEAMLQQTRVETVRGYWVRFLEQFPDVASLAQASLDQVQTAWSGLGYYRRARALRAAAQVIVRDHGGRFPSQREAALALPGVGPYTAGAVLSIAYGKSEALVDGNVARVFARLAALREPLDSPRVNRWLWDLARALVPREEGEHGARPGSWNQALMELGATLCTPRQPRCLECPLALECAARAAGVAERVPSVGRKRPSVDVELELLLVRRGLRLLCRRREEGQRLSGLWELPTRQVSLPSAAGQRLWPPRFDFSRSQRLALETQALGQVRHSITHHRIRAVVRAAVWRGAAAVPRGYAWLAAEELEAQPLSGITRKVLSASFVKPAFQLEIR